MKQVVREENAPIPSKPGRNRPFPWGRMAIILISLGVPSVLIAIILATHTYSNVVILFLVSVVAPLGGILTTLLQWLFPRNPDSAPQPAPALSAPMTLSQVDIVQEPQAAPQSSISGESHKKGTVNDQIAHIDEQERRKQPATDHVPEPLPARVDPQQTANLLRPTTVFLAYADEDRDAIKTLQLQLNLRGICCRSLADVSWLGSLNDGEIEKVIEQEVDALIVYITPTSLNAPSLWNQLVPAALRRNAHASSFSVLPIVRDLSLDDLRQFCASRFLPDLTRIPTLQQIEVTGEQIVAGQEFRDAAGAILKAALPQRLQRIAADSNYEPALCLRTSAYTPPTTSLDLDLDWTGLIPEKECLPSPEEWENSLMPALRDVKQSLSKLTASRRLRLSVQCILPVAIACGFTFPLPSHFVLSITNPGGPWSNEGQPTKTLPLHSSVVTHTESNPCVAVVELAISRSTEQGVTQAIAALDLAPGHHLRLEPLKGPARDSIKDNAHAAAMARQIGQVCQELVDRQGVQHIHLFLALTASLSVMVGQHLNALCPITLYNFQNSQGTYKACGTLR